MLKSSKISPMKNRKILKMQLKKQLLLIISVKRRWEQVRIVMMTQTMMKK
jgi:hypothetical protein